MLDEEGFNLPDVNAAKCEAIRGARGLMAAELETGVLRLAQAILIHDEFGRRVGCVPFHEAVEVIDAEPDWMKPADSDYA